MIQGIRVDLGIARLNFPADYLIRDRDLCDGASTLNPGYARVNLPEGIEKELPLYSAKSLLHCDHFAGFIFLSFPSLCFDVRVCSSL